MCPCRHGLLYGHNGDKWPKVTKIRKLRTTDLSHSLPVFINLIYSLISIVSEQIWVIYNLYPFKA